MRTRPACCPAPSSSWKEGKGGLGENTHQRTWQRAGVTPWESPALLSCYPGPPQSARNLPLPPPAPPRPSPSPASGLSFACCRPTSLGSVCLKLFLQRSLKCPQGSPNPPQGPHRAFVLKALPLVLWANFLSSLDAEPPWRGDTRGIPVLGQGWSQMTCAFSMKYTLGFPDSL